MGIVSAIERQIHYFKTQCDVRITEKECNGGFEENCASWKLLVLFLQDANKRHCHLHVTDSSGKYFEYFFYSCNLTFTLFPEKVSLLSALRHSFQIFTSHFICLEFFLILAENHTQNSDIFSTHFPFMVHLHSFWATRQKN